MQNIIRLIQKFQNVLLFVLLQFICFLLIIGGGNEFHRASFASSSNRVAGSIYLITSDISSYFNLEEENQQLVKENLELKKKLLGHQIVVGKNYTRVDDTIYHQQYDFMPGKVINSSITSRTNFLTLNVGSENKVGIDMAVVGTNGVVGKVVAVSASFSTVRPIINEDFQLAVRHQGSKKFAKLIWKKEDNYEVATVIDMPSSVKIYLGDVIETQGADALFPEGVPIGKVVKVTPVSGETYQELKIELLEDFSSIYNVTVIKNLKKEEQLELEELTNEKFQN